MENEYVIPPWNEATVKALNDYQECGMFHPYTCSCTTEYFIDNNKASGSYTSSTSLIATTDGWVCPKCGHTQSWVFSGTVGIQSKGIIAK